MSCVLSNSGSFLRQFSALGSEWVDCVDIWRQIIPFLRAHTYATPRPTGKTTIHFHSSPAFSFPLPYPNNSPLPSTKSFHTGSSPLLLPVRTPGERSLSGSETLDHIVRRNCALLKRCTGVAFIHQHSTIVRLYSKQPPPQTNKILIRPQFWKRRIC